MTSSNFCFLPKHFFSLANNDTDISKTHLNKAEQIVQVNFYLRLQDTENFDLSASRTKKLLEETTKVDKVLSKF